MAEEYQIATPEAVDISYDIAGIGSRFVATAIDVMIAVGLLILVGLGSAGIMQFPEPGPTIGTIALITLIFLIFWGYYVIFEALWSGQTPGKNIAHIRVIKTSGHPIGFIDSLIRNLIRIVDFLPSLYALGVVVMFINSQSRRLGDLAAGTIVVKERVRYRPTGYPPPAPRSTQVAPLGALDPEEIQWDLRSLSAPDIQIVEDYLARAPGFSAPVRDRVGAEVAQMVCSKIGARVPLDPGPFLRRVRDLAG